MNRTIEISSGTILRAIFILLLLWILYLVRDILVLVFLSIIIVSAIDPIVDWLQKKKVPRSLTVLVVYVLFISLFVWAISLLIPPLTTEIRGIGESFPILAEKFSSYFKVVRDYAASHNLQAQISSFTANIAEKISQTGSSIFSGTLTFIEGIFSFVIILSIAFYMSVQEKGIKKFFASLVPEEHREYVSSLVERIQFKMGRWLQGQLLLMFLVFGLDYIGLLIIRAPYALVLALIAGVLEIIPYIGPVISAIIAVSISFLHGPLTGFLVLALFVLVQQLESYVLTPLVMKKAVGLNPVIIIISLLVGAKLAGVLGVIISIPVAVIFSELFRDVIISKKTTQIPE